MQLCVFKYPVIISLLNIPNTLPYISVACYADNSFEILTYLQKNGMFCTENYHCYKL